jgi:phosphotransferase system enzyme I (PtsP)
VEKKHLDLLLSISELDWVLASDSGNLLRKIVDIVSRHMKSDVCSIYLYDEDAGKLVLKATEGLPQDAVDRVTLKLGEGLVGKSLKDLASICVKDGFSHPGFKYISGINEELYRSFLVVPIARGITRIGVLILQRKEKSFFKDDDERAVRAIASQLANIIENAKLFLHNDEPQAQRAVKPHAKQKPRIIKGTAAAGGYAYSKAHRIDGGDLDDLQASPEFSKKYTTGDIDRALALTEEQLVDMQKKTEQHVGDAGAFIFAAHILMLKDRGFVSKIRALAEQGENPPAAVMSVAKTYSSMFSAAQSQIIREKSQDISDVTRRIITNMIGLSDDAAAIADHVVIASDLYPSDMLKYFAQGISGMILTSGGVTSHVSILARSLKIPLIISDAAALDSVDTGTAVLMDADVGNIYVNPSKEVIRQFTGSNAAREKLKAVKVGSKHAETSDGKPVRLMLNINLLRDMEFAKKLPCEGIGLYRTEFPFILRSNFPTEEEQYRVYRTLLEEAGEREVTFRTLDVGGDKVLAYYHTQKEENPFLGMRSIRFSLANREIFRQQMNAILRAGHDKNIRVMFPMISSLDEFMDAKSVIAECADELSLRRVPFASRLKIGIMVEIPSVVTIIDTLAPVCDFFSIGTNDLIQYTLAVDRTNEKVASYYLPHHPAVLRSLKAVADAAIHQGISVSVCGDMANNPAYIPFLLGIGISEMSIDPVYFGKAYHCIAKTSSDGAQRFAQELLACRDIRSATKLVQRGPKKLPKARA